MTILYIILGLVAAFIFFGIIGTMQKNYEEFKSQSETKTKSTTKKNSPRKLPTVKDLVSQVNTLEDYKKLYSAMNRVEKRYYESHSDYMEDKYNTYVEAFETAGEKVLHIQYVPTLDVDSTMEEINNAYTIVPIKDYHSLKNKLNSDDDDWCEVSLSDYLDGNIEGKYDWHNSLIECKKIVDNDDLTFEDKIIELNKFGEGNEEFASAFYYGTACNKFGSKWAEHELSQFNIPLMSKLFELGYNTPSKIIAINLDELKTVSGFGPSRIEKMKIAINQLQNYMEK